MGSGESPPENVNISRGVGGGRLESGWKICGLYAEAEALSLRGEKAIRNLILTPRMGLNS
jgi:hypothetical protein